MYENTAPLILWKSPVLSSTGKVNYFIVDACSHIWVKVDATDYIRKEFEHSFLVDP